MAARAIGDEYLLSARHCAFAKGLVQVTCQIDLGVGRLALVFACLLKVVCLALGCGQKKVENVRQSIFNRAEVGAVTAALADVERRLSKVACLRIKLAQIGEVIDPALLGAGSNVEVHALDGA